MKSALFDVLSSKEKGEFIDFLVGAGALQFGDFTTKSGRKTPYFINTGRFDDGLKIATLGKWYAKAIAALKSPIESVFGPAYKGIPLAVATAAALAENSKATDSATTCSATTTTVGYTFNRKEVKAHGDGGMFVGYPLKDGSKVALVEDVITAGTTMREVLPMLRSLGVSVVAVLVAVDRMERGQDSTGALTALSAVDQVREDFSVDVRPLITLLDIIEYVKIRSDLKALLPAIEQYRAQYGV